MMQYKTPKLAKKILTRRKNYESKRLFCAGQKRMTMPISFKKRVKLARQ